VNRRTAVVALILFAVGGLAGIFGNCDELLAKSLVCRTLRLEKLGQFRRRELFVALIPPEGRALPDRPRRLGDGE
jgi:hypothetical protein